MPTPIVPNVIKAQVVLQGASDLPEDRFINTFHFAVRVADGVVAASFDRVAGLLSRFYNEATAQNGSLAGHMSSIIRRTAASHVRCYDLGQAEPRTPHVRPLNLADGPIGTNLPNELAIAASYFGNRNVVGERGRIFFGPLTTSALEAAVAGAAADRRVSPSLIENLAEKCQRLAGVELDSSPNNRVAWVLLSQGRRQVIDTPEGPRARGPLLAPQYWNVTSGWIDNAFDIQRRRGTKASARTPWVQPVSGGEQ